MLMLWGPQFLQLMRALMVSSVSPIVRLHFGQWIVMLIR
jgi:hypothetical protein